jgi:L,D-transpeptidase YcbB
MPFRHALAFAISWLTVTAGTALAEGNPTAGKTGIALSDQNAVGPTTAGGLAPEFAAALGLAGKPTGTEREDRAALTKFYEARQYEPAWITVTAVSPAGRAILGELAKAGDWGLDASAFRLPTMPAGGSELSREERAKLDVAIGLAVLKYARQAHGSRVTPNALSKYIDRKPPQIDPAQVIDGIAKASEPDAYLRAQHPQHAQFERLRQKYLALKQAKSMPGAETTTGTTKAPNKAASGSADTVTAKRILINMEEWRWMPEQLGDFYVWVNIPEFLVRVVRNGKVIHTERVVVGKIDTQTPNFSDEMEQIVFHPIWGVPDSIKQADILPSLMRGSGRVLERYNLRIQQNGRDIDPAAVDWQTVDIRTFHVYQPPGDLNLLGQVKFRFPNKYDVYMHDTPQKNLFNAPVRALSHGCMRVRDPLKLAELLLAEDQGWPTGKVGQVVASGQPNNQITLKHKIPVHITYFTAAVEDDGKLKLFADLYDHESKVALALEGKTNLIPHWKEDNKPIDVVGSLSSAPTGLLRQDWKRRVFDN